MKWILWLTTTYHSKLDLVDQALINENPGTQDILTNEPTTFNITLENIRRSQLRYIENCLNIPDELAKLDALTPVYMWYIKNTLSEQETYIFAHLISFIHPVWCKELANKLQMTQWHLSAVLGKLVAKKVVELVSRWIYQVSSEDENFLPFCVMRFHPRLHSLLRRVPQNEKNPIEYIIKNNISVQTPIAE